MTTDLGHGRGWLAEDAARSVARLDRALGHPLQITEAGRSWTQQKTHWDTYQKYGRPIALHPDTPSVHQKGRAIDSDEAQRHVALMAEHGWIRTVYRGGVLVEPWHFEYDASRDKHINEPAIPAALPTPPEEADDMYSVQVNGNQYAISKQYLSHYGDLLQAKTTREVTSASDELHRLNLAQFVALLDGLGIPREAVNATGQVLNPQSGKHETNGTWSREREILASIATFRKAA